MRQPSDCLKVFAGDGKDHDTGGGVVDGDFSGVIDTTGPVIVRGDMRKGSLIRNTGGGEVHGVLDGTFDTTGEVKVYGSIGPNGQVIGGRAVFCRMTEAVVIASVDMPPLSREASAQQGAREAVEYVTRRWAEPEVWRLAAGLLLDAHARRPIPPDRLRGEGRL